MDVTPTSICAHGDNGCKSDICNQLKKLTRRNHLPSKMSLEGMTSPVPPPGMKNSSLSAPTGNREGKKKSVPQPSGLKLPPEEQPAAAAHRSLKATSASNQAIDLLDSDTEDEEEILKPAAAATSSSFAASSSSTSNSAIKLYGICSPVDIDGMSTCDITKRVVQTLKECGNSDANKLARRLMDLFTIENADVMAAIIEDAASFRSLTVADLDTVAKAKQVEQRNSRVQSPLPFPRLSTHSNSGPSSSKKKGNKKKRQRKMKADDVVVKNDYSVAVSVLAFEIKKAQEDQSKKGRGSNVGGTQPVRIVIDLYAGLIIGIHLDMPLTCILCVIITITKQVHTAQERREVQAMCLGRPKSRCYNSLCLTNPQSDSGKIRRVFSSLSQRTTSLSQCRMPMRTTFVS